MSDILDGMYDVKSPLAPIDPNVSERPLGNMYQTLPEVKPPIEQAPQNVAAPRWEDSKPINESTAPSWADSRPVFDDQSFFNPTKQNWGKLRQAFGGDPLAVFDPDKRLYLESALNGYNGDSDEQKQRFALAAYYSQMRREDYGFVLANLPDMIERYNNGKPQTVAAAYQDIANLLNPPQQGSGGWMDAAKAGFANLGKTTSNLAVSYLDGLAKLNAYQNPSIDPAKLADAGLTQNLGNDQQIADIGKVSDQLRNQSAGYYSDVAAKYTYKALDKDWFYHWGDGRWMSNAGKFLATQAPTQAAQVAAAVFLGPVGYTGLMGASTGIDKYYDLSWSNPEMSDEARQTNAMLTGVINSGLAWIPASIVKGKIPGMSVLEYKGTVKSAISYFAAAAGVEASQEFAEQMAENAADLATGVHGDVKKLSDADFKKYLWDGCAESAFAGGAFGMMTAGAGMRNYKQMDEMRHAVVNQLSAERDALLSKGKAISEKELFQLKDVNQVLDGGNLNDQLKYVRKREIEKVVAARNNPDELQKIVDNINAIDRAESAPAASDMPLPDLGYDVAPEVSEEAVRAAASAARSIAARRELPHNPADVADAVDALRSLYAAAPVEVVPNAASFSDEVKQKLAESNRDPERVRGFVDNGTIYINASRVRPSEIPALLLHEGAAHLGLRKIFPKQFNDFLDAVYREHYQDDDFQRITAKYLSGALTDAEQFSIDDLDSQRLAAEEYVAHFAEYRGIQPNWFKELMQQIRMFLAKLPGMTEVRFTDQEIAIALARGARAMQKGDAATGNTNFALREVTPETRTAEGQKLRTFSQNFETALKQYKAGQLVGDEQFEFGPTPDALTMIGVPQLPVGMSAKIFDKATLTKHNIDVESLSQIPAALYNPVMVFDSSDRSTNPGGKVVLTEIVDKNNKPVVIALNISTGQKNHTINGIASIHARNLGEILGWIDDGLLRYSHKKRALAFARFHRLQLPKKATISERNNNTIIDETEKIKPDYENNLKFSLVSDPELLKRLDSEKTIKVYRAAQLIDGKLYPPMAAKVAGEMTNPIELGKWEQSDERADLVKNGKFKLDKANGSAIQAAYNPYFHTSRSPLNDQFSSAYKRPNLVTMEVEVPASELTSGYKADGAKDAVGEMEWHSGPVSSKLTGDNRRRVILSRWDKPVRIIPDSEVADRIAKMIDGSGLSIPENVISPSLRAELEKRNVEIKPNDKDILFSIAPELKAPNGKPSNLSEKQWLQVRTSEFKAWFGDWENDPNNSSKVVDQNGEPKVVYHNTDEKRTYFDRKFVRKAMEIEAHFFAPESDPYKEYGPIENAVFLKIINPADHKIAYDGFTDRQSQSSVAGTEQRDMLLASGYDGLILMEDNSPYEYAVFNSNQIKSATDNIGTYDPNNPDIRYSIEQYSPEEQRDFVNVLAPFVGSVLSRTDAEYAAFLKKMGVELSERDAHYFAVAAMEQNSADARKIGVQKRERWLYENVPLYAFMIDQGGADFKIQLSGRFKGAETSGTFIAKKKNEGLPLDALAREYVKKFGGEELAAEQEIFDFFKDLKKPDLYKMYTDYKAETILRDKNLERQIMEEFERMQRSDVEQEAEQLVADKQQFTPDWIKEHKDVFAEIYQKFFGKDYPGTIGKADLTALNEAIAAGQLDLFNVYREARQAAAREYMAKLADFKENMMKRDLDRVKLQREALNLLDKNLPASERGAFARKIVGLLEFSTNPSANYPDGRRAHEFNKLVSEIMGQKETVSRESSLAAIREMLDAARVKRNYKNIPTSVLPGMQSIVNEIDKIMGMNVPTLNHYLANNLDRIAQLEQQIEQTGETDGARERLDELQNFNMAAGMFGNVDAKSAAELDQARNFLQTLIRGGRAEWRNKLTARLSAVKIMRDDVIDNATFGKRSIERGVDNKKHFDFILKIESLRPLLSLISGGKNLDDTVLGRMYQALEAAKEAENTGNRVLSDEFNRKLEQTFGIKGMIARGKKLIELGKVAEKSGVFIDQYSVTRQNGSADRQVIVQGQRPVQQVSIKVEDARKLLQKIDNGETVAEWRGNPANDFAVEFLRKQLLDYDAGLKFEPEHFSEISDDANFNRLIAEDYKNDKLSLFSNLPEETSTRIELPLSQLSALQLYLTYQQADYKNLMRWNGWSDESIKQLEKFLTPETIALGNVMRDMIAGQKTKLNQIVVDRYGAKLPDIAGYFPAVFGQGARFASDSIGRGMGQMSMAPDFLIARKFHLKAPATDANAMTTFFDAMVAQTHYISHSEAVRDFKSVFGNKDVQDAIANNFGSDVSKNIIERIDVIAKAGGRGDRYLSNLFNNFYRNFIPAKLAVNAVSAAKQLASVYGFMHKIPAASFFKGMAKAYSGHADFRNFLKMAVETDYFKNRWSGAFDKDLTNILNTFKNGGATTSPVTEYLLEKSLIMTKAADAWSVLTGGYAVYEHTLNNSVKQGYSAAEAKDMALAAWQRASDETQQSGALLHQNYFQSQQGLVRYLTMFQTSPIQLSNLQFEAFNQLRYGKDKKAAAASLAKAVVLNHIVLPLSMQLVFDALTKGFDFEDYEVSDYLIAGLLGQLNSVFLFGKITDAMVHGIAGDFRQNNFNSLPMIDEWLRDAKSFGRLFDDSRDVTEQDMLQMVKATGDGLMAAGTAYKPVGGLGAVISGAAGQVKRWLKTADGQ